MNPTTTPTKMPVLKLERVFNATPERLWSHWTDPKKYAKWLNPAPIDLVIHEFDVRPGGKIRLDMPQPDGNKNPQEGVFHELVPFKRLVTGDADKSFVLVATFQALGARRTRLTIEVTGVPPEWHAAATEGWGKGLDKLAGLLEAEEAKGTAPAGFVIERTFKAPPDKVWRMWTTPDGVMKWWAVSAKEMGYAFQVLRMDVRVGGTFAFGMKSKEHDLVNRGTYRVVDPARELAWTWHFDIFLKPGEAPYDVPIQVRLEKTATGGTKMTFTQGPLATPEFTEGSHQGVLKNLEMLDAALRGA